MLSDTYGVINLFKDCESEEIFITKLIRWVKTLIIQATKQTKLLPLLPITGSPLVHISHTQTPIPFQYLSQNLATTYVRAKFPSSKHQPTNNQPSKSSIL